MGKIAHTPGPWIVKKKFHSAKKKYRIWATQNDGFMKYGLRDGDFYIADVGDLNDARIMAAAPDLLMVAQMYVDLLAMDFDCVQEKADHFNDLEHFARASINKAKGRE